MWVMGIELGSPERAASALTAEQTLQALKSAFHWLLLCFRHRPMHPFSLLPKRAVDSQNNGSD